MRVKYLQLILYFLLIVLTFQKWILFSSIFNGDFPYYYTINNQLFWYPFAWLGLQNLGGYNIPYITSLFPLTPIIFSLSNIFNLTWTVIAKLVYFYPTLILSFVSIWLMAKIMPQTKRFFLLSAFIFLFNTYTLMILGGGQMLYALGMSIVPAVLAMFLKSKTNSLKRSLLLGILFALLIALDIRIAYMMMIGVILFLLIKFIYELRIANGELKDALVNFFYSLVFIIVVPGAVAGLLHAFWIVPTLFVHQNPFQQLGAVYSTNEAVKFFSFATFGNTLALLHPNWPENIFGKIYFMRPEFLVLPILAFSSLLFLNYPVASDELRVKNKNAKCEMRNAQLYIIYFALLGLLGAFLAKGANDPFGGVYLWLFAHVPGFVMFRDPTKWYLLIAISYSMLIPYTIGKVYEVLKKKFTN